MAFEARILFQGAGLCVTHGNRRRLLMLAPNIEYATTLGFQPPDDANGAPCHHHSVIQANAADMMQEAPDMWASIDVGGSWVTFDAEPVNGSLPAPLFEGDSIPGLPSISKLLAGTKLGTARLDQRALPGSGKEASVLASGFFADSGMLSPASEFQGRLRFPAGEGDRRARGGEFYSGVLKLELGRVNSFALRFRSFGAAKTRTLQFRPGSDQLDVWVRHVCDLRRPGTQRFEAAKGAPREAVDDDFILNYSLLEGAAALARERDRLPIPVVLTSWLRGEPISGGTIKCMRAGLAGQDFEAEGI